MRRRAVWLVMLTVLVLLTGVNSYRSWVRLPDPDDQSFSTDGKLRVLILGVDPGWTAPGKPGVGRSDTLMLATYDPQCGEVSLLSIPRDSRVEIPGYSGMYRINSAYAFGGVELTRQTVRNFLNIPLNYYVKIDITGFVRLVDAIGGVTIDVEKDMDWDDNAGDLHIHLKKGLQTLDGKNALDYVRYRHSDSDLVRAARQQKFISAMIKQLLKPANLLKIPELSRIAFDAVQTNIPLNTILRHASAAASLKDNITAVTLEGTDQYINGSYYFIPDLDKLEQLVDEFLYSSTDQAANNQVRVTVRYGNGSYKSASKVAQLLQKAGFQVPYVTAAEGDDYPVTQVYSLKEGATASAMRVAEAISVSEVLLDPSVGTDVDVVVVLGKDILP